MHRKQIMIATLIIWLVITIIYGYLRVLRGISLPGYGYEVEWQFQLLVFMIVRLPILLVILAIILVLEYRFLPGEKKKNHQ